MISHLSSLPWTRVFEEQDKHLQGQIILYALMHYGREVDAHGLNCDHILTFYTKRGDYA